MMLETFINNNDGKMVSADGVPSNAGQSVQLIVAWCKYLGLPFQWTLPAYWWDDEDDTFLEHWNKVVNDHHAVPSPGDIIIFGGNLPGSDGDGHGSIFLQQIDDQSYEGFDANWGGMTAHKQSHSWAYVLGWFTPKNRAVLESPIPTAIADESPYAAYVAQPIEPKVIIVKLPSTPLYNLNDVSWNSFQQNPIKHMPSGLEVTITAVANHRLGGTFYLPDIDHAEGYRVEDCQDYGVDEDSTEELVIQAPPKRILPHITSPLMSPKMDDTILITKRIPYYQFMTAALNHTNPAGDMTPGSYFVYKRISNGMLSITNQPGVPMGRWINPDDLVEKPPFHPQDHFTKYDTPRRMFAREDSEVPDLDRFRKAMPLRKGQALVLDGFVTHEDGRIFAIPRATHSRNQWYGVLMTDLTSEDPNEKPVVIEPPTLPAAIPTYRPTPSFLQKPERNQPFHVKMLLKARELYLSFKT